jgi:diacylglycerol kinase (ATP)
MNRISLKKYDSKTKRKPFSFIERINGFRFALDGIRQFFIHEHNARIHLVATILVFAAAYRFRLSRNEVIVLVIVTGAVWSAEIFNTAIEKIMNHISPGYHHNVKCIKDLSAAAVLVTAIVAAMTGLCLFMPKIF